MPDPDAERAAEIVSQLGDDAGDHFIEEAAMVYVGIQREGVADALERR